MAIFVVRLCFSKLKKLILIFIMKKSYEISLSFHLILFSLINFEYTLPFILSTALKFGEHCLYLFPLRRPKCYLTKVDETDGFNNLIDFNCQTQNFLT